MEHAPFTLKVSVHAKGRGDGDPAVRLCEVGSWPGALRRAPNGTPQTPPTDHWLQRQQRSDHLMSDAKVLKTHTIECESFETAIRKRRLLFAGAIQWTTNERLTRGCCLGRWLVWRESGIRPTRRELGPMSSRRSLGVSSHRGVHANLPFALRSKNGVMIERVAKKSSRRWYRGVIETADCFMARWHRDEAQGSRLRHAAEDAKSGDKGGGGGQAY